MHRVLIIHMPHISGEHRQHIPGRLVPGNGSFQRVDGERMSETVRGGVSKSGVADDSPGAVDADLAYGTVEDKANTVDTKPLFHASYEQIGIDIMINQSGPA